MFWYSSNVTDESSVFLRATLILRLGVRALVAVANSTRAVKRMVAVVRCAVYQLSVSLLRSLLLLR